jgi:prepilin-type N-terminal cleavage/methylation domain-containing protein
MPDAVRRRPSGFTLIEILVVITIIGLLMTFAAVGLSRYRQAGAITDCKSRLESLTLTIESYADRMGDLPPAHLADLGVKADNAVNEGVEALVVCLRRADFGGRRPDERWLANVDDDHGQDLKAYDGTDALLELVDPWDAPLAYFVHTAYDEPGSYSSGLDGVPVDVHALRNPLTGAWHRFDSFQLRSAGPDGLFDTEDDLANFALQAPDEAEER